jgi:hypothetical protein
MTTKWREADAGAAFGSRLHLAGYQLWTRIFEDDVIFRVEKCGHYPNKNSGGYRFLESAVKAKGITL